MPLARDDKEHYSNYPKFCQAILTKKNKKIFIKIILTKISAIY
jgi:hypothetical protein